MYLRCEEGDLYSSEGSNSDTTNPQNGRGNDDATIPMMSLRPCYGLGFPTPKKGEPGQAIEIFLLDLSTVFSARSLSIEMGNLLRCSCNHLTTTFSSFRGTYCMALCGVRGKRTSTSMRAFIRSIVTLHVIESGGKSCPGRKGRRRVERFVRSSQRQTILGQEATRYDRTRLD